MSHGSCKLILGAMYTGKSTELLRLLKVEVDTGAKVICINSIKDTRCGDDTISTHNSLTDIKNDGIPKIKLEKLNDFRSEIDKWEVIGVDEGQFFSDINSEIRHWVLVKHKTVIVASLNGDFDLNLFGDTYKLIPICAADHVKILGGRCVRCLSLGKARSESIGSFTLNKTNLRASDHVIIGGKDIYETVCLKCHLTENSHKLIDKS